MMVENPILLCYLGELKNLLWKSPRKEDTERHYCQQWLHAGLPSDFRLITIQSGSFISPHQLFSN